jgi:hypothetical protein
MQRGHSCPQVDFKKNENQTPNPIFKDWRRRMSALHFFLLNEKSGLAWLSKLVYPRRPSLEYDRAILAGHPIRHGREPTVVA